MNSHLSLVPVVALAVWLGMPCQVQSGHFDVLRGGSPNVANQGVTITIQLPEGILRDQRCGEPSRPDDMSKPRQSEPALHQSYSFNTLPSRVQTLSVTVKLLLSTGTSKGSLSIPGRDANQQEQGFTFAIPLSPADSVASTPVNGRPDHVSLGLPRNGRVQPGPYIRLGTLSRSGGPHGGRFEPTVMRSYQNPDTLPELKLLDRRPKNTPDFGMKIFSDIELGRR
jgi:hypothetical protein